MKDEGGLRSRISADMKTALKNQEKEKLAAIRLILSAVKQIELSKDLSDRVELGDAEIWSLLDKMKKQRLDSIEIYEKADRVDLAAKEKFELSVITDYLPTPLDEAALQALIQEAVAQEQAQSIKDLGKVVARIRPLVQGRADMSVVTAQIKALLA